VCFAEVEAAELADKLDDLFGAAVVQAAREGVHVGGEGGSADVGCVAEAGAVVGGEPRVVLAEGRRASAAFDRQEVEAVAVGDVAVLADAG